ncbi:MAG TPA: hypothetical protein VHO90_19825 [Bacteroidales bacterium]|nr:hypothetical protein [Bacteroidales bacterium]
MKPNFYSICRIMLVAIFFVFIGSKVVAQSNSNLELKYKVDSALVNSVYQYSITIKVINRTGPFTYYLFLGEPLKNGQILKEAADIKESSYTFKNVPKGSEYHIGVKGVSNRDANWTYIKF